MIPIDDEIQIFSLVFLFPWNMLCNASFFSVPDAHLTDVLPIETLLTLCVSIFSNLYLNPSLALPLLLVCDVLSPTAEYQVTFNNLGLV